MPSGPSLAVAASVCLLPFRVRRRCANAKALRTEANRAHWGCSLWNWDPSTEVDLKSLSRQEILPYFISAVMPMFAGISGGS